jgi:hypothetical protein
MIPTYELGDEDWNKLVQDVADHFGEVMMSRGFQYFKRGRVVKLTIPSQRLVKALVEGGDLYHVELNLDSFAASRCGCPVGSYCKHMFAVILKYADMHNRSIHTLVNAKSISGSARTAASNPQAKAQSARKAGEELQRLQEQTKRLNAMSVSEWHEWFAKVTERFAQSAKNAQFVNDALAAIYRVKPVLPPEIESWFVLHAQLFVLAKLTKQSQDQTGYVYAYLAFHTHHAASDLQDSIRQKIAQAVPSVWEPEHALRVIQTLDYVREEMLAEANENRYFLHHYLELWTLWISPRAPDGSAYGEELARLNESAEALGSSLSRFAWKIALGAIRAFQAEDSEAWTQLTEASGIHPIPTELLLRFPAQLAQEEQWSRLAAWLAEITPLLSERRSGGLRAYSDYWETAVQHCPEAEPRMWDALMSMLPQARALYEEKLLENGKWQRWMDYQLAMESDPSDFRVAELAPLEKNAPELLLPFYHQAVEKYVLLKNRHSYKIAVKLLKRLAKLYKKLKQEPRWEQFLDSFIGRHSRLRALQEELRKGKLL